MALSSLTLAGVLWLTLQITVTLHILLHKEDVPSAIGWIGLVWLAPLLGSVAYVLFGINRVRRKALRLRSHGPDLLTLTGKTPQELEKEVPAPLWQLMRLGYKVHPQHLALGNRMHPLQNGDEAYPQMCAAIAAAKKQVLLASYIFNNDTAGQMFVRALRQARQNGAEVRVLVDGVGLNYSRPDILQALKEIPGLQYKVFLRSKSPVNLPFLNLRNHRKILVTDDQQAFFGGMNIARGNLVAQQPAEPIQDITFSVQGPVVHQMARVFEEDWIFCGGKACLPPHTPPAAAPNGTPARIVPDGPDGDYGKIEKLCLGALACAQKSVQIVTPYFLPENDILSALETAALRGVRVEIILPQKSNIFGMDWAMQANFRRLLRRGVHIYRARPPFDHSKLFLVDEVWVMAGSANWDVRSFKLNFESIVECFDPALAGQVHAIIEAKKRRAVAVPFDPHIKPALWATLRNNALRLLTPYY